MATYVILNSVVTAILCLSLARYLVRPTKVWWYTLGILLVLTAVFDNLIIHFGIVGYNTNNILGIYIGEAPIEDFMYTVAAVIMVPALWKLFKEKHEK